MKKEAYKKMKMKIYQYQYQQQPVIMSFIQQNCATANRYLVQKQEEEKQEQQEMVEKQVEYFDNMSNLTVKYYPMVCNAVHQASCNGKRELYIYFDRRDFGFPQPGKPKIKPASVCCAWIKDMQEECPVYVPKTLNGEFRSLKGIRWDVWNNQSFTVHFTW